MVWAKSLGNLDPLEMTTVNKIPWLEYRHSLGLQIAQSSSSLNTSGPGNVYALGA